MLAKQRVDGFHRGKSDIEEQVHNYQARNDRIAQSLLPACEKHRNPFIFGMSSCYRNFSFTCFRQKQSHQQCVHDGDNRGNPERYGWSQRSQYTPNSRTNDKTPTNSPPYPPPTPTPTPPP